MFERILLPAGLDRTGRDAALKALVVHHHKQRNSKRTVGSIEGVYPDRPGWVRQAGNTDERQRVYYATISTTR